MAITAKEALDVLGIDEDYVSSMDGGITARTASLLREHILIELRHFARGRNIENVVLEAHDIDMLVHESRRYLERCGLLELPDEISGPMLTCLQEVAVLLRTADAASKGTVEQ